MSFNSLFGLGSHSSDAALQLLPWLQDNAASTAVVDSGPGGINGTLNGGNNTQDLDTTGPNGWLTSALDLDGAADYVNFGDVLDIGASDDAAWGCWANLDAFGAATAPNILGKGVQANANAGFAVRSTSTGTLQAVVGNGTARTSVSVTGYSTATWYLVAGNLDRAGSLLSLYVNGASAGSTSSPASGSYNGANNLQIGRNDLPNYLDGRVSGAWKFSRSLTASEHAEIKDGPEPVYVSGSDTVTGTPQDGETLSVSSDVVYGLSAPFSGGTNGTVTYSYQWTASDDGSGTGEANISGATGATFTATSAEVGKYLRRWRRAINTGGFDPAEDLASDFSGVIVAAGGVTARGASLLLVM